VYYRGLIIWGYFENIPIEVVRGFFEGWGSGLRGGAPSKVSGSGIS